MKKRHSAKEMQALAMKPESPTERGHNSRILSVPDKDKYLDSVQLQKLEQSFRDWTQAASKENIRASRLRVLLVFLLIRHTGAKLSQVLDFDPARDIDVEKHSVRLGHKKKEGRRGERVIPISENLCREIQAITTHSSYKNAPKKKLNMDPGFVRQKFYERAEDCGIAKQMGAPEIIRKSRAVELMQSNMPLPAVQMVLGHSTPNLTTAYVSFSDEDIKQVTRLYMEKESARKTSARNAFFGKIQSIRQGDIQSQIELITVGGHNITTVITNDSVKRLGLKEGKLITAEVKAPWVMLHKSDVKPACSADNMLYGTLTRISKGRINTEYIVRLPDETEVCSIVTTESGRRLSLEQGDEVWVVFNCFAVVLLSDL